MPDYFLSVKAREDLFNIYLYSFEHYGETRADAYLSALEERFMMLAEHPSLGRDIDPIRQGYLRYKFGNYSIYYRTEENGIFIVRILHNRMDVDQHLN